MKSRQVRGSDEGWGDPSPSPPCGSGPLGPKLVTASADMTSRVYNVANGACVACFQGHEGEISKA